jgi:hypothetical protein
MHPLRVTTGACASLWELTTLSKSEESNLKNRIWTNKSEETNLRICTNTSEPRNLNKQIWTNNKLFEQWPQQRKALWAMSLAQQGPLHATHPLWLAKARAVLTHTRTPSKGLQRDMHKTTAPQQEAQNLQGKAQNLHIKSCEAHQKTMQYRQTCRQSP